MYLHCNSIECLYLAAGRSGAAGVASMTRERNNNTEKNKFVNAKVRAEGRQEVL